MTRRSLLALLIPALSAAKTAPNLRSPNPHSLLAFHVHYNAFFRQYFGCEDAAWANECRPSLGTFNAKEWQETCSAARKAFGT